jgi:hypothetical protein
LDRKKKEELLRKKKKVGMTNKKLRPRKIGLQSSESTTSIRAISNPAAAGGLLGSRNFGMKGA